MKPPESKKSPVLGFGILKKSLPKSTHFLKDIKLQSTFDRNARKLNYWKRWFCFDKIELGVWNGDKRLMGWLLIREFKRGEDRVYTRSAIGASGKKSFNLDKWTGSTHKSKRLRKHATLTAVYRLNIFTWIENCRVELISIYFDKLTITRRLRPGALFCWIK